MKKAAEYLETFDLEGNYLEDIEREKFYKEIREEFAKTGRITRQVKTIRLFLLNSEGRLYLQKRSKIKDENSGLYDKTIGGHVYASHSYEVTVTKECAEELGFPAAVLSGDDFKKAVKRTDLDIVGLFREVSVQNKFMSLRIGKNGEIFSQPLICAFYVGYFNGPIKFVDGECSGIETFSIDELEAEMKANPMKFTNDTKVMYEKYKKYLVPLRQVKK